MKFAKYLESESIPEWRKAYINYKRLKKRLTAIERYRKSNHVDERTRILQRLQVYEYENSSDDQQTYSGPGNPNFSLSDFDIRQRPTRSGGDSRSLVVLEEVIRLATEPEQYFFVKLDDDLNTISRFYDEKEKEAEAKYIALKMQVQIVHSYGIQLSNRELNYHAMSNDVDLNPINWLRRRSSNLSSLTTDMPNIPGSFHYNGNEHLSYSVARSRLKKAITEYYRSLQLVKSYRDLNELGFQKILKKFDKTAGWKASQLYLKKMRRCHWAKSTKIQDFINGTEKLYIDEFADGHRRKGMANLRTPEKKEQYSATTCRIGFYLGISVALLANVLKLALNPETLQNLPNMGYNLQIYACFSIPIIFCLGFAVNTIVWTKSHINYKFIFEFDPRDNLDYHQFAELPSLILLILSCIMYIDFSQLFAPLIPSELCPLLFLVITLGIMTCPFHILYYYSRRWLSVSLGRILLSYFFPIEFRDFFLADELNSLSYSFWTFSYFVCAYHFHWTNLISQCSVTLFWFTPLLASLPPWWRFLQCIRRYKDSREKVHLVNALKYVTSIGATLATGFRRMHNTTTMEIIWIVCGIINSSYTSAWDLKMDWGLFQPKSIHLFLRNDLVFHKWTYYAAIPINITLRYAWALNAAGLGLEGKLVGYLIALLEAYRRIQWNFFRLENEHINNCGNYHAIKEIPLPFAFNDYTRSTPAAAEEGSIHLPFETHEIAIPPNAVHPDRPVDVTPTGSFYGRRDFENRQDLEDAETHNGFKGVVLEHIRSRKSTRSDSSDTDDDDHEDSE